MLPGWSKIEIGGKPADLFEPVSASRIALLYLHPVGLESLSENEAYTTAIRESGLACVSPFGARSWWSDRICPEFDPVISAESHLLSYVLPWMESKWRLAPRCIAISGISMGGQGAIRLGLKHADRFPVVAGIASAIDYHEWYGQGTPIDEMYRSREACRQDTATLHVHPSKFPPHLWFACDPDDEEWFRGNDRLHEKLMAMGIAHTVNFETRKGGHCWDYFNAMAEPMVKYCKAGLEKEARRLM